jgi:drug/metabolite transporter (DMT)-like permease
LRSAHTDWDIEDVHAEPKGNRLMLLALILSSVAFAAAAQIVLKHGMNVFFHRTGHAFRFDGPSIREILRIAPVWIGLALFGLSAVVWLAVLSRAALSYAYPFAALTYVVIVIYDTVRGEAVTGIRWAGVLLIVAGIILVSRTPHGGPGSAS